MRLARAVYTSFVSHLAEVAETANCRSDFGSGFSPGSRLIAPDELVWAQLHVVIGESVE
jgi:hypothetical protein